MSTFNEFSIHKDSWKCLVEPSLSVVGSKCVLKSKKMTSTATVSYDTYARQASDRWNEISSPKSEQLLGKIHLLEEKLCDAHRDCGRLKMEISLKDTEITTLRNSNDKKEIVALTEEIAALRKEINKNKSEVANLIKKNEREVADLIKKNERVLNEKERELVDFEKKYDTEMNAVCKTMTEKEAELKTLQDEILKLKNHSAESQAKLLKTYSDNKHLKEKLSSVISFKFDNDLQSKLDEYRHLHSSLEIEHRTLSLLYEKKRHCRHCGDDSDDSDEDDEPCVKRRKLSK
jgi:chromosome segregation ATPase